MNKIIVDESNLIIRISNDFIMQETIMKPNEYILYLNIFRLIQMRKCNNESREIYISKNNYEFKKSELIGIFNEQTYKKSKFNSILDGMYENQLEEIISDYSYDGKVLNITFDEDEFDRYFMAENNYTTIDIMDIIGSKGIQSIKMIMLFNRFSKTGWIKIKEEDIRVMLGKCDEDVFDTKHITWDVKNIVKKFREKYFISDFIVDKKNNITYEFKFNKFEYIY